MAKEGTRNLDAVPHFLLIQVMITRRYRDHPRG